MSTRSLIDRWAESAVLSALAKIRTGTLRVALGANTHRFGDGGEPHASLDITDPRFFRRALTGGEIGIGESYMDGEWSTPDLVGLIDLMLANRDVLPELPRVAAWPGLIRDALGHRRRDNSRAGSRSNIRQHYDLGNEFFELFLDTNMMYSCAVYERSDDSLDAAQVNKLRTICQLLDLGPRDRVLEIGTGWGGFALFAATRYGCHVTTTTVSPAQHAYVADLLSRSPTAAARVDLRLDDYRDLTGHFDKIVSIEMFEAVGLRHYDEFFAACDRLLERDGMMLLQTITVDDWRFAEYRRTPNWIAKYIFPGAELAAVGEIVSSLTRVSRLNVHHARSIGRHYAQTLHHWRQRFHANLACVRGQGFDARFIRMWDLYLAYCEAAFRRRHINDVQLLLTKDASQRSLVGEPWREARDSRIVALESARAPTAEPLTGV